MRTSFSIKLHDGDGDSYDEGIFIHVSDSTLLRFECVEELEQFANDLIKSTIPEIKENLDD